LFHQAGISWKKDTKCNPKKDPELVEKKTGNYILVGGAQIESGELVVLFVDECHLLWGGI